MTDRRPPADADEAAAFWYARLQGDAGPDDRRRFAEWRLASAEHRRAWDALERADRRLDALIGHPALAARLADARRGTDRPARPGGASFSGPFSGTARLALAASLTLAILGGAAFVASPWMRRPAARPAAPTGTHYATAVGERRTITLADGSRVTLDTDSALFVPRPWGGRRDVTLVRGQALFDVARDPARPFVVTSRGRTVRALGTRFAVRDEPDRFSVALLEGKVRVDLPQAGATARILAPGDTLDLQGKTLTLRHGHAAAEAGWMRGRLSFDARPLADIVAELNRYSPRRIVLDDAALGQRAFSGTFDLSPEGSRALVVALQGYGLARVVAQNDREIRLTAR